MAIHSTTAAITVAQADGIVITVNAALTGTITTTTGGSTQYGTAAGTIGVITNPAVGNQFRYGGLRTQGAITVTPSTACDITVSLIAPNQV